jgi:hypothetical protein
MQTQSAVIPQPVPVPQAIKYFSPIERKVHKALFRYGESGGSVFEVRKIVGDAFHQGTIRNCLRTLSDRGLVRIVGTTCNTERMARDAGMCDLYAARVLE